jgi:crotonobetainyl-CoA:carnitine CoA-transferase CaiB-like acyl-CoA transferase
MTDKTIRPMAGLKVVELGTLIAGPFASRILAEFGADVVKVESPDGGDPLRKWRLLYEGTSLWWFVQARNKKSVTLNLKHPDGASKCCVDCWPTPMYWWKTSVPACSTSSDSPSPRCAS